MAKTALLVFLVLFASVANACRSTITINGKVVRSWLYIPQSFIRYLFSISSSGRFINYTSKTSTINGVKMGEYTFENNTHTVTTFENGTGTFTNINTKA